MRSRAAAVAAALFAFAFGVVACSHPSSATPGEVILLFPYPPDGGAVEWDGWAGTFVEDYCVSCHNPAASCLGSQCHAARELPDFRQRADVVALAPTIRCGISVAQDPSWNCGGTPPEQFPLNGGSNPFPTDEQRGIVVGWIDAGCP